MISGGDTSRRFGTTPSSRAHQQHRVREEGREKLPSDQKEDRVEGTTGALVVTVMNGSRLRLQRHAVEERGIAESATLLLHGSHKICTVSSLTVYTVVGD